MKALKILFSGLANAGKTSILRVLDNDFELLPHVAPTLGVEYKEYKVLGLEATVWDKGGQARYRAKYLAEFEKYFEDTSVLFYVIDIQADDLFEENLTYLREIIGGLKKIQAQDVYIPVIFHKIDPHLKSRRKELDVKVRILRQKLEKILGTFPHAYYETSIYEPFTIFTAFSEGLLHRCTGTQLVFQKVKEVASDFDSPAAILLTAGGYIYAAWHSPDIQLMDLVKFERTVIEFARVISAKVYSPFVTIPFTEVTDVAAMIFPYASQFIAYCIIVPKVKDRHDVEEKLLRKQVEFQKILQVALKPDAPQARELIVV